MLRARETYKSCLSVRMCVSECVVRSCLASTRVRYRTMAKSYYQYIVRSEQPALESTRLQQAVSAPSLRLFLSLVTLTLISLFIPSRRLNPQLTLLVFLTPFPSSSRILRRISSCVLPHVLSSFRHLLSGISDLWTPRETFPSRKRAFTTLFTYRGRSGKDRFGPL